MENPGKLKHRIDIMHNVQDTDEQNNLIYGGYNKPVVTEATFLSGVWAAMHTTGGGIFYGAQKRNADTTAVFKLRYQPGVTTDMWVTYGSRRFDILFVNNVDEGNEWLELSGREVV